MSTYLTRFESDDFELGDAIVDGDIDECGPDELDCLVDCLVDSSSDGSEYELETNLDDSDSSMNQRYVDFEYEKIESLARTIEGVRNAVLDIAVKNIDYLRDHPKQLAWVMLNYEFIH